MEKPKIPIKIPPKAPREQVERLADKYFWQQKWSEIGTFFGVAVASIISGLLWSLVFTCNVFEQEYCSDIIGYYAIMIVGFGLFLTCGGIFISYRIIQIWINSNKEEAMRKAITYYGGEPKEEEESYY